MGKTTLARKLAKETGATHLRVDTVENQLNQWGVTPLDYLGYRICYELAKDQLSLGNSVIADTVNPIGITRKAWRDVASQIDCPFVDIEIYCSDIEIHKTRVETRASDIDGFTLPDWLKVCDREYEAWSKDAIQIDSSIGSVDEVFAKLLQSLEKFQS